MTPLAFFAFYGVPVIGVAVAWVGVLLHRRASPHRARKAVAERQGNLHLTA